ncbi:MAG TPA: hypothetical protein PLC89_20365 [Haliscomenobacter sp.]|uniref:DUF6712 family protein n=1 Tax=Haliscomenobacter sp. TaxID=2717303 RepID=UPI002C79EC6D|nr:hypothetical protein [Haliscomenobacter sp.]HOY19678.1 hypothetical protein [Haliscomenobacter sp.]
MQLPGNPCTFREIFHIEMYEFRHSLGDAYRKTLLAAMVDYTGTDLYDDQTTYNEGDLVMYWINESLQVYRALTTTDAIPTTVDDWELAPIFEDGDCQAKYNELYCDYLAPYLSYCVLIKKLPSLVAIISDKGVLQFNGLSYQPADQSSVASLKAALESERLMIYSNMVAWLKADQDNACFSGIDFGTSEDCDGCGLVKNVKLYNRYQRGQYKFA